MPSTPTKRPPGRRISWTKVGGAAGVIAALAAIVGLFLMRSDSSDVSASTGGGDARIVNCPDAQGSSCTYQEAAEHIEDKREEEILAESRKSADTPPKGDGPWPFAVVGTRGIGLKVRTTGTAEGTHINGLADHHTAWAVCQQDTGFEPDPGSGSVWLQIKWDHQEPGTAFVESEFSAEQTAWAYAAYLVPIGHDGDIPTCDAEPKG